MHSVGCFLETPMFFTFVEQVLRLERKKFFRISMENENKGGVYISLFSCSYSFILKFRRKWRIK